MILDESCFVVNPQTRLMGGRLVKRVIQILQVIREQNYFLVDYGYPDIIRSTFPFNEDQTVKPFFGTIMNLLTKSLFRMNLKKKGMVSYDVALEYIVNTYKGREIIVLTQERIEGYRNYKDKELLYWNPFNAESECTNRYFKQSTKHSLLKSDIDITFCPISEEELNCSLSRSISFKNDFSFKDTEQDLYSFHEQHNLLIINHKTRDQFSLKKFPVFGKEEISLKIHDIEYHGYQINQNSLDNSDRKLGIFEQSSLDIGDIKGDTDNEYYKKEYDMYTNILTNSKLLDKLKERQGFLLKK
uniref:hypothetical protein n=1 Tax=Niallia taxi TaxID=2499688 RepID=UPI003F4909EB